MLSRMDLHDQLCVEGVNMITAIHCRWPGSRDKSPISDCCTHYDRLFRLVEPFQYVFRQRRDGGRILLEYVLVIRMGSSNLAIARALFLPGFGMRSSSDK